MVAGRSESGAKAGCASYDGVLAAASTRERRCAPDFFGTTEVVMAFATNVLVGSLYSPGELKRLMSRADKCDRGNPGRGRMGL